MCDVVVLETNRSAMDTKSRHLQL